jgi:hypothetical protein
MISRVSYLILAISFAGSVSMASIGNIELSFTFDSDPNAQESDSGQDPLPPPEFTPLNGAVQTIAQDGWVDHVFAVGKIHNTGQAFEIKVSEADHSTFLGGTDGTQVVMRKTDDSNIYIAGHMGLDLSEQCPTEGIQHWSVSYPCVKVIDSFEEFMNIPADELSGDITLLIKGYSYASGDANISPGTYQANLQISTQPAEPSGAEQSASSDGERVADPYHGIGVPK